MQTQDTKPAKLIVGNIIIDFDCPVPLRIGDDASTRKIALAIEKALNEAFEGATA